MTHLIILVIATGWTSYYASQATFDEVVHNRQNHLAYPYLGNHPDNVHCYAAGRTADEIGDIVYIKSERTSWIPCWVVDTAGVADGAYQWMVDNNIHYEVDPATMLKLRGSLGGGVRVRIGRKLHLGWLGQLARIERPPHLIQQGRIR